MAKLTIEIDIPDAIMETAMSKKTEGAIKKMCQMVCQLEVDRINKEFLADVHPIISMAIEMMEEEIRDGKMVLYKDAPPFLKHMV